MGLSSGRVGKALLVATWSTCCTEDGVREVDEVLLFPIV